MLAYTLKLMDAIQPPSTCRASTCGDCVADRTVGVNPKSDSALVSSNVTVCGGLKGIVIGLPFKLKVPANANCMLTFIAAVPELLAVNDTVSFAPQSVSWRLADPGHCKSSTSPLTVTVGRISSVNVLRQNKTFLLVLAVYVAPA